MENDIVSMGYRKLSDSFYCKPVGYSMIVISMKEKRIKQIFKAENGKKAVWNSKSLSENVILEDIKNFESFGTDFSIGKTSNFNFITDMEYFNSIL